MSEVRLYTREEIEQRLDQVVVEVRRELADRRRARDTRSASTRPVHELQEVAES